MKTESVCTKCGLKDNGVPHTFVYAAETETFEVDKKKKNEITIYRFLEDMPVYICPQCIKKNKRNYILVSLLFLAAAIPFFVMMEFIELGAVLGIAAVTITLLAFTRSEAEYIAKKKYYPIRDAKEGYPVHPVLFTKEKWEKLKASGDPRFRFIE